MYYGVFLNLNVQSISPRGKDRLPKLLYTFYPVGVCFYNQGDSIFESHFFTHSVSRYHRYICIILRFSFHF